MPGIERIIDLTEQPCRLRTEDGLLLIDAAETGQTARVPLAEVAAVMLSHPRITCTRPVLSGLAQAGAPLVICDDRCLPVAMCLPLSGYHAPARRLRAQAAASLPTCKRIWQQIVRAKIRAQARMLQASRHSDFGLPGLAARVRSGDPDNCEAQASRIYWPALFGVDFLRDPALADQNRLLNYGYAVLRAIVARAICATGLHPGLGVHHHHRDNAYCLADDLMEPFRPVVDHVVDELVREHGPDVPINRDVRARLLGLVLTSFDCGGETRGLFDVAARLCASLASIFEGRDKQLVLPLRALH